MDGNQDDPDYRAAVLTGPALALAEMATVLRRLALSAPTAANVETRLGVWEGNWSELVLGLNQAAWKRSMKWRSSAAKSRGARVELSQNDSHGISASAPLVRPPVISPQASVRREA